MNVIRKLTTKYINFTQSVYKIPLEEPDIPIPFELLCLIPFENVINIQNNKNNINSIMNDAGFFFSARFTLISTVLGYFNSKNFTKSQKKFISIIVLRTCCGILFWDLKEIDPHCMLVFMRALSLSVPSLQSHLDIIERFFALFIERIYRVGEIDAIIQYLPSINELMAKYPNISLNCSHLHLDTSLKLCKRLHDDISPFSQATISTFFRNFSRSLHFCPNHSLDPVKIIHELLEISKIPAPTELLVSFLSMLLSFHHHNSDIVPLLEKISNGLINADSSAATVDDIPSQMIATKPLSYFAQNSPESVSKYTENAAIPELSFEFSDKPTIPNLNELPVEIARPTLLAATEIADHFILCGLKDFLIFAQILLKSHNYNIQAILIISIMITGPLRLGIAESFSKIDAWKTFFNLRTFDPTVTFFDSPVSRLINLRQSVFDVLAFLCANESIMLSIRRSFRNFLSKVVQYSKFAGEIVLMSFPQLKSIYTLDDANDDLLEILLEIAIFQQQDHLREKSVSKYRFPTLSVILTILNFEECIRLVANSQYACEALLSMMFERSLFPEIEKIILKVVRIASARNAKYIPLTNAVHQMMLIVIGRPDTHDLLLKLLKMMESSPSSIILKSRIINDLFDAILSCQNDKLVDREKILEYSLRIVLKVKNLPEFDTSTVPYKKIAKVCNSIGISENLFQILYDTCITDSIITFPEALPMLMLSIDGTKYADFVVDKLIELCKESICNRCSCLVGKIPTIIFKRKNPKNLELFSLISVTISDQVSLKSFFRCFECDDDIEDLLRYLTVILEQGSNVAFRPRIQLSSPGSHVTFPPIPTSTIKNGFLVLASLFIDSDCPDRNFFILKGETNTFTVSFLDNGILYRIDTKNESFQKLIDVNYPRKRWFELSVMLKPSEGFTVSFDNIKAGLSLPQVDLGEGAYDLSFFTQFEEKGISRPIQMYSISFAANFLSDELTVEEFAPPSVFQAHCKYRFSSEFMIDNLLIDNGSYAVFYGSPIRFACRFLRSFEVTHSINTLLSLFRKIDHKPQLLKPLLSILFDVIQKSPEVSQQMVQRHGLAILAHFLEKVSSFEMPIEMWNFMVDQIPKIKSEALLRSFAKNIFYNLDIWSHAPIDVLVQVVSDWQRIGIFFEEFMTIPFLLLTFKWFTNPPESSQYSFKPHKNVSGTKKTQQQNMQKQQKQQFQQNQPNQQNQQKDNISAKKSFFSFDLFPNKSSDQLESNDESDSGSNSRIQIQQSEPLIFLDDSQTVSSSELESSNDSPISQNKQNSPISPTSIENFNDNNSTNSYYNNNNQNSSNNNYNDYNNNNNNNSSDDYYCTFDANNAMINDIDLSSTDDEIPIPDDFSPPSFPISKKETDSAFDDDIPCSLAKPIQRTPNKRRRRTPQISFSMSKAQAQQLRAQNVYRALSAPSSTSYQKTIETNLKLIRSIIISLAKSVISLQKINTKDAQFLFQAIQKSSEPEHAIELLDIVMYVVDSGLHSTSFDIKGEWYLLFLHQSEDVRIRWLHLFSKMFPDPSAEQMQSVLLLLIVQSQRPLNDNTVSTNSLLAECIRICLNVPDLNLDLSALLNNISQFVPVRLQYLHFAVAISIAAPQNLNDIFADILLSLTLNDENVEKIAESSTNLSLFLLIYWGLRRSQAYNEEDFDLNDNNNVKSTLLIDEGGSIGNSMESNYKSETPTVRSYGNNYNYSSNYNYNYNSNGTCGKYDKAQQMLQTHRRISLPLTINVVDKTSIKILSSICSCSPSLLRTAIGIIDSISSITTVDLIEFRSLFLNFVFAIVSKRPVNSQTADFAQLIVESLFFHYKVYELPSLLNLIKMFDTDDRAKPKKKFDAQVPDLLTLVNVYSGDTTTLPNLHFSLCFDPNGFWSDRCLTHSLIFFISALKEEKHRPFLSMLCYFYWKSQNQEECAPLFPLICQLVKKRDNFAQLIIKALISEDGNSFLNTSQRKGSINPPRNRRSTQASMPTLAQSQGSLPPKIPHHSLILDDNEIQNDLNITNKNTNENDVFEANSNINSNSIANNENEPKNVSSYNINDYNNENNDSKNNSNADENNNNNDIKDNTYANNNKDAENPSDENNIDQKLKSTIKAEVGTKSEKEDEEADVNIGRYEFEQNDFRQFNSTSSIALPSSHMSRRRHSIENLKSSLPNNIQQQIKTSVKFLPPAATALSNSTPTRSISAHAPISTHPPIVNQVYNSQNPSTMTTVNSNMMMGNNSKKNNITALPKFHESNTPIMSTFHVFSVELSQQISYYLSQAGKFNETCYTTLTQFCESVPTTLPDAHRDLVKVFLNLLTTMPRDLKSKLFLAIKHQGKRNWQQLSHQMFTRNQIHFKRSSFVDYSLRPVMMKRNCGFDSNCIKSLNNSTDPDVENRIDSIDPLFEAQCSRIKINKSINGTFFVVVKNANNVNVSVSTNINSSNNNNYYNENNNNNNNSNNNGIISNNNNINNNSINNNSNTSNNNSNTINNNSIINNININNNANNNINNSNNNLQIVSNNNNNAPNSNSNNTTSNGTSANDAFNSLNCTKYLRFVPPNGKILDISFGDILHILPMFVLQRQTAIEIVTKQRYSYLFNFRTNADVKNIMLLLPIQFPSRDFLNDLTELWCKRLISNFEYLTWLNTLSGRTFNSAYSYPVFPWILQDYNSDTINIDDSKVYRDLSKPVGALNPGRLEKLKKLRDDNIEDDNFLYRSTYSCAFHVFHYLVRLEPFTSLHISMQDGKFDVAHRLFSSISNSYERVISTSFNFRELIPEFFFCSDFLKNFDKFAFGGGIDNVELPQWSKSAIDFIYKNRRALESEYVSLHINEWIDLIWGYKQTGQAAEESDNVFDPHLYSNVWQQYTTGKKEIEELLYHVGQIPQQLFDSPHPKRSPVSQINYQYNFSITSVLANNAICYTNDHQTTIHRDGKVMNIKAVISKESFQNLSNFIGLNSSIKYNNYIIMNPNLSSYGGMNSLATNTSSNSNLSSMSSSGSQIFNNNSFAAICQSSNEILRFDGDKITKVPRPFHVSKIETMCSIGNSIISGDSDGIISNENVSMTAIHAKPIVALCGSEAYRIVVSVSKDNLVVISTADELKFVRSFRVDKSFSRISKAVICEGFGIIIFVETKENRSKFISYSINGELIASKELTSKVTRISSATSIATDLDYLIFSDDKKKVYLYNAFELTKIREILETESAITSINFFQQAVPQLAVGTESGVLRVGSLYI